MRSILSEDQHDSMDRHRSISDQVEVSFVSSLWQLASSLSIADDVAFAICFVVAARDVAINPV